METLIHPEQKISNESQDSCLPKAGDRYTVNSLQDGHLWDRH